MVGGKQDIPSCSPSFFHPVRYMRAEVIEYHNNRFVIIINRPYRPQKLIEALYLCVLRKTYNSLSHNWIKTHCISFHSRGVFYMWFIETPNPHRVSGTLGRIIDKVLQETIYILKSTKEVLYSLTLTLTPANNIVFIVYTAHNHFQQVFQTDQPLGLALVIHNNSDVEPASLKFLQ